MARLDRRTQRKRPQEGTDAENTQTQRQEQRKDRVTQQKRAAGDVSDGEVQRHKHRSETHSGLKRAREEDKTSQQDGRPAARRQQQGHPNRSRTDQPLRG